MKLLHCSANVPGMPLLDLEGAFDRIRSSLESVNTRWHLRGVSETNLDVLTVELVRPPAANILHFDGHGTNAGGLWLRDPDSAFAIQADPEGLVDLLASQAPQLQLVVLLACNTSKIGERLARRIGAAIAVEGPLEDITGSPFSRVLYTYLSLGKPLSVAFAAARGRVRSQYVSSPLGLRLFAESADLQFPASPPNHLQIIVETHSAHQATLTAQAPSMAQPVETLVDGRARQQVTDDALVTIKIDAGRIVLRVHAPPNSAFVGQPATIVLDGEVTTIPTLQPLPSQSLGSQEPPCILDLRLNRPT
jgi:hypothetical protein